MTNNLGVHCSEEGVKEKQALGSEQGECPAQTQDPCSGGQTELQNSGTWTTFAWSGTFHKVVFCLTYNVIVTFLK